MGALQHQQSGGRIPLAARTLVGRSDACHLRLPSARVSGVHAELVWDGSCWTIRDLDSRNGTHLDGSALVPKQRQPIELGAEVMFGTDEHRYTLVDRSPPGLLAIDDEGTIVGAHQGMLCLPSEEQGELTLFERLGDGWWLETDDEPRKLVPQEQLWAGGRRWIVHLPGSVEGTEEDGLVMTVSSIALEFHVSRDEEHVEVEIHQGTRRVTVTPRAHDVLLLTLARARLEDQRRPDLEESEHGWIHLEDLVSQLKVDRERIKLWIHRARREFADAGVYDIDRLVERRRSSNQLRLGVARLRVGR
ncbi:FHA domain-containing protein [Paraliomyxa miuraensis]|uniref:FHA domain-containing protein n=1 Tax=Paraliomyxa miuraensis TaxID=376150 RepID=UPI0022529929|nr:FHA domain-containing protein [Paraliomyxa miuraensis]MCX4246688.1 FHA domain-containing protein [Paraliomyxa miuraensis]